MTELRRALRLLRKNPGFTALAALTLALGIGANTAIFSVVNSVLLSPLQYRDSDRIVQLNTRWKETGRQTPRLTGADLVDIRAQNTAFEALSYYQGWQLGVQLGDHAEFTGAYLVNAAFFRIFSVQPVYGRLFDDTETDRSIVVSLSFAQRNFGGGAEALGRTMRLDNHPYEIVGVLPGSFHFPRQAEVWAPAQFTPANLNRTAYNYRVIAKLRPDATLDAAQAQLDTIASRLEAAFPDSNRGKAFAVIPVRDQLVRQIRDTLNLLMGAVLLVLLIACANVANLLLARATSRSREMAVRAALGAGRWRIIRQLLVESAVLAILGGALGLLLAQAGTGALLRLAPQNLPRLDEVRVDRVVLAFAMGISLLASFLFGLAPAWQASRVDLSDALKQGGSRGLVGRGSNRLRSLLVVAEIALSFVLATGATLLFRSFMALNSVDLGFRSEGVLVMYAHAPARTLDEHLAAGRIIENLSAQLSPIPGVKSVAAAMGLPTGAYGSNGYYAVEGKHIFAPGQNLPHAGFELASPGYFSAMGIPLLEGRDFNERDRYDTPFVAIVSAALATQIFPGEDPIGRRVQCDLDSPKWMTIVGVVGDVRQDSPASRPGPELYMPLLQHPYYANEVQVVLRTAVDPASLTAAVREKVRAINPSIATRFTTMETMVAESVAVPRFRTFLVGAFAMLAILLAVAGVYGVMTYLVAQRTSELGLRVALGARPADVLNLILGRAALLTAAGLALGLILSYPAHSVVASMLFGLKATDPTTYVLVLAIVGGVAVSAAAVPAWRATRIDPIAALREE